LATNTSVAALGLGYIFFRKKMSGINDEQVKGGLTIVTWGEIIAEARNYEKQALMNILEELEIETSGQIILDRLSDSVVIKGKIYYQSDHRKNHLHHQKKLN
jgi:hypothetical protein